MQAPLTTPTPSASQGNTMGAACASAGQVAFDTKPWGLSFGPRSLGFLETHHWSNTCPSPGPGAAAVPWWPVVWHGEK